MSTATAVSPGRPLKVVWSPEDAERIRHDVRQEKNRWGRFLLAKDQLLSHVHDVWEATGTFLGRLHADRAVRMVRRAWGWLFGGAALVRRGLTTAGVLPGLAWLASTELGQGLLRKAASALLNPLKQVARTIGKVAGWVVRRFGTRGARVANAVTVRLHTVTAAVGVGLSLIRQFTAPLLHPDGLPMQGVRTMAQGRLVRVLVNRVLPMPWCLLVRLIASVGLVPAVIRRDAVSLLRGLVTKPTTNPAPEDDPTPPAPANVVDLAAERSKYDHTQHEELDPLDQLDEALPSLQRYPAPKRSANANRKRK